MNSFLGDCHGAEIVLEFLQRRFALRGRCEIDFENNTGQYDPRQWQHHRTQGQSDEHPAGEIDFRAIGFLHKCGKHRVWRRSDERSHATDRRSIRNAEQQRVLEVFLALVIHAIHRPVDDGDNGDSNWQQHHGRRRVHNPHADDSTGEHKSTNQ